MMNNKELLIAKELENYLRNEQNKAIYNYLCLFLTVEDIEDFCKYVISLPKIDKEYQ